MQMTQLTAADLQVDAASPSDATIDLSWSEPVFPDLKTFVLILSIKSDYVSSSSKVTLTILTPKKCVGEGGMVIEVNTLSGFLQAFGNAPSTSVKETAVGKQTAAAVQGGTTASAVSALITGNPACLLGLVNQMQLMSYIAMTKIKLPSDFKSALAALNTGSLFSLSPAASLDVNSTSQQPPDFVQEYGISTTLFLVNMQSFLSTCVAILLSYIPIVLLARVPNKTISQYFARLVPSLKWGVPLKMWITSYLDLGVYSLLQALNLLQSYKSTKDLANLVAALCFAAGFFATPLLIFLFFQKHHSQLVSRSDPCFTSAWGAFTCEFKPEYTGIAFYPAFLLRRFMFAITLTLFQEYPSFIALVNSSMALSVLLTQVFIYVTVTWPWEARVEQVSSMISEGSVFLIYVCVSAFVFDLSEEVSSFIGMAGLWIVRLAVLVNVAISTYRAGATVVMVVSEYSKQINKRFRQASVHGPSAVQRARKAWF